MVTVGSRAKSMIRIGRHLFGFRVVSGVTDDSLVNEAYRMLLDVKATMVFASNSPDSSSVIGVGKDRSEHRMDRELIPDVISVLTKDDYYQTDLNPVSDIENERMSITLRSGISLHARRDEFVETPEGFVFGCVACRYRDGFVVTGRGKDELDSDPVYVSFVDHGKRKVYACGKVKPSLNSPLLSSVFFANEDVETIVHYHSMLPDYPSYEWAPPGTVRDSVRHPLPVRTFNIINHGSFELYDRNGCLL